VHRLEPPCPSIFERERPLAENTLKRIARGIDKYVLKSAKPFIVGIDNKSSTCGEWSSDEPLRTVTLENRFAVAQPFILASHGEFKDRQRRRCRSRRWAPRRGRRQSCAGRSVASRRPVRRPVDRQPLPHHRRHWRAR
jgi:hypothetical protein